MANSVDPDQTAPIGAVCSGSTLFASILNLSVILGNSADDFQQTTFSDAFFFLGALRVKCVHSAVRFAKAKVLTLSILAATFVIC